MNLSGFNPVDSVKEACVECGIDWKSADFDEKEMLRKFQEVAEDKSEHF